LVEFRLLGPVELWIHGRPIDLGPTKNKLLLAVLLMEAGATVSLESLVRFTKRLYATFETSYREMHELSQRVLRRLALHPGSAISLPAAAALAGASLSDTDFALDLLVEHHLLTEPERHRYRMHDLVRGFAAHLLDRSEEPESVAAAQDRFAQFILTSVEGATALFHPYRHTNLLAGARPASAAEAVSFTDPRSADHEPSGYPSCATTRRRRPGAAADAGTAKTPAKPRGQPQNALFPPFT
jgi:hypothetical protein